MQLNPSQKNHLTFVAIFLSSISPTPHILQAGGSLDANVTLANFLQADTREYFYYEVVFIFVLMIILIIILELSIMTLIRIIIITAIQHGAFHYPERCQYAMNTILLFIAIVNSHHHQLFIL